MPDHKLFGKIFTAFQNSTVLTGTHNHQSPETGIGFQKITYSFHQRILRTYHEQIDLFILNKITDSPEIGHCKTDIFSQLGCPCIPRSHIKFSQFRTLNYFPRQRMFTPSASQ